MDQVKKCIRIVSNLNGSVSIDCKVIKNSIRSVLTRNYDPTPGLPTGFMDHNLLAYAAYMNPIKEHTNIMSNLYLEYTKRVQGS